MNRKTIGIAAGVVALAVAGFAVWSVWFSSGVQAGPGLYESELEICRVQLDDDLQHPDLQDHLDDTVWHQVDGDDLHIGGKVMLLAGDGKPAASEYQCLIRGGRIINLVYR